MIIELCGELQLLVSLIDALFDQLNQLFRR